MEGRGDGLTFSGECGEADAPCRGICHIAAPGEPEKLWWLGFDCGHYRDLKPSDTKPEEMERWGRDWDNRYRTFQYVQSECAKLAAQLAAQPVTV